MLYWWENLPRREKLAVAAGALAVALLLLYVLLHPLLRNRARLREEVNNSRTELAWMQDAARQVADSGYTGRSNGPTGQPLQFIDQAAKANHLGDQLQRMEPGSNGEIKVWLNNAAYVNLVHWLRQLSTSGRLAISNLNVEKGSATGLVNAQLTLSSSGTP